MSGAAAGLRIVMFVYGDVTHDSRVLREAGSLSRGGHQVTVVARPVDLLARRGRVERRDGFDLIEVPLPGAWRRPWRYLGPPLRFAARVVDRLRPATRAEETLAWLVIWQFAVMGWARAAASAAPAGDVYHGHDLPGLTAAVAARRRTGGRVLYDSHEIFLESGAYVRRPAWIRRRLARREQAMLHECAALVTVNDALVAELARRYDVPRAIVVHNCPPRWEPPVEPDGRLRSAVGVPFETPLAVYHGSFSPHRGLEQFAVALLEPGMEAVHAAYLGYGSQRERLQRMSADSRFGGRMHVLEPVPPHELVPWISGADVAVMALQPNTLNHVLSTPNKLFEAVTAGVPVVASDFPALRAVVMDDPSGPLGEVCDPSDPAAIAIAIGRIVTAPATDRAALRLRCLEAAHARWTWEAEAARLLDLYRGLAGTGTDADAGAPAGAVVGDVR